MHADSEIWALTCESAELKGANCQLCVQQSRVHTSHGCDALHDTSQHVGHMGDDMVVELGQVFLAVNVELDGATLQQTCHKRTTYTF